MENFLPDGYELPKSKGRYTKFEEGETKVRILRSAIVGWEYFNKDNKPMRSTKDNYPQALDKKPDGKIKEFWATVVWNYGTEQIEVMEITQTSIKEAIMGLIQDEEYGSPLNYDLKVKKTGKSMDTSYQVLPSPAKPVSEEIMEEYKSQNICLEELFVGGDPFEPTF